MLPCIFWCGLVAKVVVFMKKKAGVIKETPKIADYLILLKLAF